VLNGSAATVQQKLGEMVGTALVRPCPPYKADLIVIARSESDEAIQSRLRTSLWIACAPGKLARSCRCKSGPGKP